MDHDEQLLANPRLGQVHGSDLPSKMPCVHSNVVVILLSQIISHLSLSLSVGLGFHISSRSTCKVVPLYVADIFGEGRHEKKREMQVQLYEDL